jgi:hypothetical protein
MGRETDRAMIEVWADVWYYCEGCSYGVVALVLHGFGWVLCIYSSWWRHLLNTRSAILAI